MSKSSLFRRILAPKRIVTVLSGLFGAGLLMGAGFESLARREARLSFPVQGRLVDVGGRRLQLDCRGAGSPTVVFEAGLDLLGSLSWAAVHDSVAQTTRACAYSRAGIMWSDASKARFTSNQAAADLHAALANAAESGPFVMVAHSLGGPYAMTFTGLYGPEVAGVVLVDASHPDQIARLEKAVGKPMTPQTGVLAFGSAIARTGLPRLMTRDVAPTRAPGRVREISAAYAATSLRSLLRETTALSLSLAEAGQFRDLGTRPLIVLAAMAEMSAAELQMQDMTREQEKAYRAVWRELQRDESTWSRRGRLVLVQGAAHYIQLDRPDVVIAAVREVVCTVRSTGERGLCEASADAGGAAILATDSR